MAHLLDDEYLKPFEGAIRGRAQRAIDRMREPTGGKESLADWANAHNYFGLHLESIRVGKGSNSGKRGKTLRDANRLQWVFREWAPKATSMWLIGDFNGWKIDPRFECMRIPKSDVWEVKIPAKLIKPGQKYHLEMRWEGGHGERIPAYARYVVQNPDTKLFEAVVYESKYVWQHRTTRNSKRTTARTSQPLNLSTSHLRSPRRHGHGRGEGVRRAVSRARKARLARRSILRARHAQIPRRRLRAGGRVILS